MGTRHLQGSMRGRRGSQTSGAGLNAACWAERCLCWAVQRLQRESRPAAAVHMHMGATAGVFRYPAGSRGSDVAAVYLWQLHHCSGCARITLLLQRHSTGAHASPRPA